MKKTTKLLRIIAFAGVIYLLLFAPLFFTGCDNGCGSSGGSGSGNSGSGGGGGNGGSGGSGSGGGGKPPPITPDNPVVYIVGYYNDGNKDIACYWEGGVKTDLYNGTGDSSASAIAVSGNSVYIGK
ncbi:MAG: hypothetical protein LBH44_01595 [Treponema sp.]|jgi:hypothetical protein|nr:hypothetical protein [Treponema sp.]